MPSMEYHVIHLAFVPPLRLSRAAAVAASQKRVCVEAPRLVIKGERAVVDSVVEVWAAADG